MQFDAEYGKLYRMHFASFKGVFQNVKLILPHSSRLAVRDCHRHHGSSAVIGFDGKAAAAHKSEPLLNVFQGNMRRIIIHAQATGKPSLLYGQVCAGVLQFRRKRDGRIAGNSGLICSTMMLAR